MNLKAMIQKRVRELQKTFGDRINAKGSIYYYMGKFICDHYKINVDLKKDKGCFIEEKDE